MISSQLSTPLVALDAIVLDTETTGLDASRARIVQIGAVRLEGGKVQPAELFDRLVNPGGAIPAESTAIHGITDDHVKDAPEFSAIAAELQQFIGNRIVIGHTIGYDLIMLRREAELSGLVWLTPRALDVRLLAELAMPTLAQFDLDMVASALSIGIRERHTATGDALATAEVFLTLLPILRKRGIRTLADAETASKSLMDRLAGASRPIARVPAHSYEPAPPLVRTDSFPYRHRVSDVMSAPPVNCEPTATVRQAAGVLLKRNVSSVLVRSDDGRTGIATERDLLRAIDNSAGRGLDSIIDGIASRPVHGIEDTAFVYRAIGRMERLGIRHLAVTDSVGEIIGVVTTRNLLRHRASTALVVGDEIETAATPAALGKAWARLPMMARILIDDAVAPHTLAAIVSSEITALTRRAAEIGEQRMAERGDGPPPVPYAVLVLGSAGRCESLLAADQDNAIVYECGQTGGPEDRWFEKLGGHIAGILDEVGIAYCKGGVMAKNEAWRHSVDGWCTLIDSWVQRQRKQDLLNVDIFFDAAVVHGEATLGETVLNHAFIAAGNAPDFQMRIVEQARQWRSPLTLLGGLKSDQEGRLDLKMAGLFPIVSAARAIAIRHGIRERSTPGRLRALLARDLGSETDVEALIDAQATIIGTMLTQQLADGEAGIPLSSRVDVKRLSRTQRSRIKQAIGAVSIAIDLVGEGRL